MIFFKKILFIAMIRDFPKIFANKKDMQTGFTVW